MPNHQDHTEDDAHDVLAAEAFVVPARDPALRADEPHDVLAAEEFGMGVGDSRLRREEARDVLAAEEFVVPAGDPALAHGPVTLPPDPTGIAEPHDVLAAEEFALPYGRGRGSVGSEGGGSGSRGRLLLGACVVGALLLRKRVK
jgi:hypothetical protein